MKAKIIKFFLTTVIILIIGIAGLLIFIKTALPNVGAPLDINIDKSAKNIERGQYLANHVMVCMDCHSKRDWSKYSGPIVPNSLGMGGEIFDQKQGFPGKYIAPNLTPYHLSNWSDGEIFRAITTGVSKNGRSLFPIMPHHNYGQLDKKDIEAVIAYIRSIKTIENKTESSISDFPMNFIINTIPQKAGFTVIPDTNNVVDYGKYLVKAASCYDCHTKQDKGSFVGQDFAGGMNFSFPDGTVITSSNITPHQSGIGNWTREQFIGRFKMYSDSAYIFRNLNKGDLQTVMPWSMYAGMTNRDLSAIYDYLKTIESFESEK